jgi:hypothetical protein
MWLESKGTAPTFLFDFLIGGKVGGVNAPHHFLIENFLIIAPAPVAVL